MKIQIAEIIKETCPALKLAIITCKVTNTATSDELWAEMSAEINQFNSKYNIEDINKIPQIAATRKAYKAFGKDPNRYRPSAEALCRRIKRDIPIYRLSTLVDIINIVSIRSGLSIGGFDSDKLEGENILLKVGTNENVFEAIGRGLLNVTGLPIYHDSIGGIGTPTSDVERTKIELSTNNLLIIMNAYNGELGLNEAVKHLVDLLNEYANAKDLQIQHIN